jgi:hypothetical protein
VSDARALDPAQAAVGAELARPRARPKRRRRARQLAGNAGWYLVLTLVAAITVFPFLWMLSTSL